MSTTRSAFAHWSMILVAFVVMLFPAYWMLVTSVKLPDEIFHSPPTLWPMHPSLRAFITIFHQRPMLRYLSNSLIVSLGATCIAMFLSALAAYGFTRFHIKGAMIFIVALLFTRMLPNTVLIVPYFQMMSALNLVDTYTALILAYSSFSLPFSLWMLIGFFRSIPARH